PISWTVRVANAGPDGVSAATLTISGTGALNIVAIDGAGDCSETDDEWHCELETLARAGEGVFTVTAEASAGAHTLSASVTSTIDDPVASNDAAESSVTVRAANGVSNNGGGSSSRGGGGAISFWLL